ncbi:hypothetical protein MVEN_00503400 [Mycena venus]|uniref:BTB domain-containing protein n=1 Tax=Mycena venus TaxID=2733690 RepID=A0A8H7D6W8_9AGAR|nr:hypothetical protein MVEN_00503400 [Mycena venus]
MEDIQPSPQRLRVDSENAIRDPNFYTEDGNIVLAAKETDSKCTVYFRLHRSILMKHSPVFKDMFAMPCPPSADQYDGVPLVVMAGDSADALRSLIALLYDPQSISVLLKAEDFAARMYEPVVLAKKYQIDWIPEMAASHLDRQWPQTLTGWDRIADVEITDALAVGDPECYEWDDSLKLHRLPEPATAIRLARECDTPQIIPLAFLHLLRQPYEVNPDLWDEDILHAQIWETPERQLLTTEDLKRLALARERIGKWFASRPRNIPEDSRDFGKTYYTDITGRPLKNWGIPTFIAFLYVNS